MSDIKGYTKLTEEQTKSINEVKELAEKVGEHVDKLFAKDDVDKRWVSIAKTDLQKGLMSLVRSIAKPETF